MLLHGFDVKGQIPCGDLHTCHCITCTCSQQSLFKRTKCSNYLSATKGSRDGAVVRVLASPAPMWPEFDSGPILAICALFQGFFPGFLPPEKPTFPISDSIRIEDLYEKQFRLMWLPLKILQFTELFYSNNKITGTMY